MSAGRYRLSFTTGGLFIRESVLVATRYLELLDWHATRLQVRTENLLQLRTSATSLRISKEIVARLGHLSSAEIDCLIQGSHRDAGYLLWSGVCRRYAFINDFAIEVVREHYLTLRHELPLSEFNSFFYKKAAEHDEIENTTTSTQNKLRQNVFRMMRESDLLSDRHRIQPAMLTPGLAKLLAHQGRGSLNIFPIADTDIARLLQ